MSSLKFAEPPASPEPMIVRRKSTDAASRSPRRLSRLSPAWKRIGLLAGAGILFGLMIAILFQPSARKSQETSVISRAEPFSSQSPSTIAVVPTAPVVKVSNDPAKSMHEMEQLRTRNRRLEALVKVLKKRASLGSRNRNKAQNN